MVKNEINILIAVSGSMLGLSLLASVVAMQPRVNAASSSASASVTVSAACTLSGANHNYYDTISGGETKTFGPSSIKATCNDTAGYSLYAIGFSGDSYFGDHTKMIGTNANINTATSGTDSYWAMQVLPVAGTYTPTIMNSFDSSSFHVIPDAYAQIAKYTSITDAGQGATGSNLEVSYKVSISATQGVDTYTGKVKYTLVHPNTAPTPVNPLPETACSASQICYAPNAGDIDGSMSSMGSVTGSSTAGKQTGVSTNGIAVLRAPNFSREGYGFAGWSTDFEATASSVVFGPNQTITTSTTAGAGDADVSSKGLILYPVWAESAGTMQSDASTACSGLTAASYDTDTGTLSASLSSISALTDERDGNTYAIAKLADNNCWMIENLRLDAENTLDDANKALAQGYKTWSGTGTNYGNFTGLADSENANFTITEPTAANNATNSIYSSDGSTTININSSNYPAYRIPRYNNNNTNRSLTPSYSGQWYGYGNYYNWPAAMANTTYYSGPTATDADGYTSETVGTSLCPTGWQLPYGRNIGNDATTKGFPYLDIQMGGTGASSSTNAVTGGTMSTYWRQFPNNFVYSGSFSKASAARRSSSGYYWSSTAYLNFNSYSLYLNSSTLDPGTSSLYKYYGVSIRCLASS